MSQRILVVGAGYVGLTTAVGLAGAGHEVEVIETNAERRLMLQNGRIPIFEPGLEEAFRAAVAASRLTVSDVVQRGDPDLVMLCVGTPVDDEGEVDLSQVRQALAELRPVLDGGAALVIRSTMPVGYTERVLEWAGVPHSRAFTNPEFLRQGHALADFRNPTRVVIGRFPEADPAALDNVVSTLRVSGQPLVVVSVAEADLIKNGSNAFLALRLSFANELSVLSEEVGADIDRVIEGIGLDPRLGLAYLRPGFGFGGSCLPKELKTLAFTGYGLGLPMHVTAAASDANASHQVRFARRIETALEHVSDPTVGLLGLAFKAGTDDVRFSPALHLARHLLGAGIRVRGYDPTASENAARALPDLVIAEGAMEALRGADAAIVATEWPGFADLDWETIRDAMRGRLVFDGRRILDAGRMTALGFRYETIGGQPNPFGRSERA